MLRRTRDTVEAFLGHVLPLVEHFIDELLHPRCEIRNDLPGEDVRHILSDGGVLGAVHC